MHIEPMYSLAIKRVLFLVSIVALAVIAVSCDRDTPTQSTIGRDILSGGGTTSGKTTFSARATAAQSVVLGSSVKVCGVSLPPEGGEEGSSLLAARLGTTVSRSLAHPIVFGHGDRCRAQSTSADLDVRVGTHRIPACLAMSGVDAVCVGGSVVLHGDSQIGDLRIDGRTVVVTGAANQTIWLPLGAGRIVINEQVRGSSSITVRALRISIAGAADVIVSESQAGISCATADCGTSKDFVTGGGWIHGPSGDKATFGVSGGIKSGSPWGHLTYVDHGAAGPRVKGTGVTSYTIVNSTTRHIEGTCEVDGRGGFTYAVDVADNGEPGSSDMFRIRLSNGYVANGTLQGGNIQLHTPCR